MMAPTELHMPDASWVNVCIGAQALYVLGRSTAPDPNLIMRGTGFTQGEPLADSTMILFLLERGMRVRAIGTDTSARMAERGLHHIKDQFGHDWTESHDAYFTAKRVAHLQQLARRFESEKLKHKGRLVGEVRVPTCDDVDALLRDGYAVSCVVRAGTISTGRVLLMRVGSAIHLYTPRLSTSAHPSVYNMSFDRCMEHVHLRAGIVGITR